MSRNETLRMTVGAHRRVEGNISAESVTKRGVAPLNCGAGASDARRAVRGARRVSPVVSG